MGLYKSWDFCKHVKCYAVNFSKSFRVKAICSHCEAYQMHQYLKANGQILEEGSVLAEKIKTLEKALLIIISNNDAIECHYPYGSHDSPCATNKDIDCPECLYDYYLNKAKEADNE